MINNSEIIITCLYTVVNTVLLQYVWNNVLVKHVIILYPIESMVDAFLMSVGITMFR